MLWNKRSLNSCKLYLVLDTEVAGYDRLLEVLKSSLSGGVDIVQLRDKRGNAKDILEFAGCAKRLLKGRVPFIINDRVDLALAARADGVHLGQEDLSVTFARRILGAEALIGVSCQTLPHLRAAVRQGADYIGFGSVFKTQTKPSRSPLEFKMVAKAGRAAKKPIFFIGGISASNIPALRKLGVSRVAVCRAILESRDAGQAAREIKRILNQDHF